MVGSGNRFMSLIASGFHSVLGILLPGNGALPLVGSSTVSGEPLFCNDCEKSPCRSRAVGMVRFPLLGLRFFQSSTLTKKKSLFLLVLKTPGIYSGPPSVKPPWLLRSRPLGVGNGVLALLVHEWAFIHSARLKK